MTNLKKLTAIDVHDLLKKKFEKREDIFVRTDSKIKIKINRIDTHVHFSLYAPYPHEKEGAHCGDACARRYEFVDFAKRLIKGNKKQDIFINFKINKEGKIVLTNLKPFNLNESFITGAQ